MKRYRDIAGDGGSDVVGQVEAARARLVARLAAVRAIVAVVSGKGGVGKSSLTANLAVAFASRGLAVGVLDADLNGPSMAKMLGVRGHRLSISAAGVLPATSPLGPLGIRVMSMDLLLPADETPVVWDAPTPAESHTWRGSMEGTALREFLTDTVWGPLDLLLLDLPPGTDRLPAVAGLLPALAGAVVVTIPSEVSHLIVRKSLTLARESGTPLLGLVENMAGYVCPRCGEIGPLFEGPGGEVTAAQHGIPFLGRVPFDPRLARAADLGRSVVLDHAESPAAQAIVAVTRRLTEALAGRPAPP